MTPQNSDNSRISENLLQKINEDFGSFEEFTEKFESSAMTVFGSGWV
jgi:Fe-Mn family superoxide dismutase